MGDATGFPVMRLSRTSFAGVTSEGLRPGTWRPMTTNELQTLKKTYGVPRNIPVQPVAAEACAAAPRPSHMGPRRPVSPGERDGATSAAPEARTSRGSRGPRSSPGAGRAGSDGSRLHTHARAAGNGGIGASDAGRAGLHTMTRRRGR